MKRTVLIVLLVVLLPVVYVSAQKAPKKLTITGVVLDLNERPMPNAFILVDGVKTSILTDASGQYTVKVKASAKTIGIVSLGNGMVEQEIDGRSVIDFHFNKEIIALEQDKPKTTSDDQSVNTGYNEVDQKNLTTTIGKVKGDKVRSYATIYEMLQTVPGVQVSGTRVVVQDAKNLQGYVEPLYLIDGVKVSSIDGISPATVKSIEVLKGAAATVYGTQAYGGVILIKLKTE